MPSSPEETFLGLHDLPPKPVMPPGLAFVPWRRTGNLLVLSGHGPQYGKEFRYTGKVGAEVSVAEGYAASRLTALNLMHTVRDAIETLERVSQIVEVVGMVNSAPGFTDQSKVVNGCSECLIELFGELGKHARAAVGMAELPFNICVEITMLVEVKT